MNDRFALARAYFCQQQDLGMPDIILRPNSRAIAVVSSLRKRTGAPPAAKSPQPPKAPPAMPAPRPAAKPRLLPVASLMGSASVNELPPPARDQGDSVREALVALYTSVKDCKACPLGARRTRFVFGSGNVHAPLLIVGEAPGAEENEQGLPFVGAAGQLLTAMLEAIGLDRKKDAFITNILKCRPPGNRTPGSSEIDACRHILTAQIGVMRPRMFLLLGRIAAHALLSTTASIASLRKEPHMVNGIPAFVTYHPSSLLRNPDNKRPAWEDMRKLKAFLSEMGAYGAEN